MKRKPALYMDTTVVSYYTAKATRDPAAAHRRAVTRRWWSRAMRNCSVHVSVVVTDEASRGDAAAAERRLRCIRDIPALGINGDVDRLMAAYFKKGIIRHTGREDALHIAISSAHGMDYPATWNFKHMANHRVREIIEKTNRAEGLPAPLMITPEELLETDTWQ